MTTLGTTVGTTVLPLRQALSLATLAGRPLAALNFGLRVAQGILPLLGLLAMQWLLDAVAHGIATGDPTATAAVPWAVAFAAGVALVGAMLGALSGTVGERHARRCADASVRRLQRHVAGLDLLQLESPTVADLLHRAGAEAGQRPVRVVQNLAGLVLATTTLVVMLGTSAQIALWLPLAVAATALPQGLARLRASRELFAWQAANTEPQRRLGYLSGLLVGRAAAKDLRVLDLATPLLHRVDGLRDRLTAEQLALQARRVRAETITQVLGTAALFFAYLFLCHAALRGELSLGALLLQVQAVQRTQNGVRDAMLGYAALRDDQRFLHNLFALFAIAPRIRAPATPRSLPAGPLSLDARSLRFAYPATTAAAPAPSPVLDGLDLQVPAGQRIALVGRNGTGKSTLVRLLCRLMDPDQGTLALGGEDLRAVDPTALRRRLAVFFQDAAGLESTVRDNLDFDAPAARDGELLAAADVVGMGDLLRKLPAGLDTALGRSFAGARELSAGQWRRLLLARTLARPAGLMVLDEPFAFLDADARLRLVRHLQAVDRQRTVLLINHQVEALWFVDRIVVLDGGQIVADGPPGAPPARDLAAN